MGSVSPKLLIILVVVILLFVFVKMSNPYREFSTREYWAMATIESVYDIPEVALKPGNRNGSVLMWAAMAANDPGIISALVERGAGINEADGVFMGTPLSGAAGYSANPAIIDRLIELGADIHQNVNNGEDTLMIAAQYNINPGIIERLIYHGADINRKNKQEKTALDLAIAVGNKVAQTDLERLAKTGLK